MKKIEGDACPVILASWNGDGSCMGQAYCGYTAVGSCQ